MAHVNKRSLTDRETADLLNRFEYHAPGEEKVLDHTYVRGILYGVATELTGLLPEGREKSLAITHLEEAMFWSNAALARSGATGQSWS